jgi:hypothetical protein
MTFMTRREFIVGAGSALVSLRLPFDPWQGGTVRAAVVADVHHGLAPDAQVRLDAFLAAARKRANLDFALQMGDFCHPGEASNHFVKAWRDLDLPQVNVLGNHDMDKGTKRQIMDQWGMQETFGAYEFGGFRFVVLDLNHFKKGNDLTPYAYGNYFQAGITHNWADRDQLSWLERELKQGDRPTILISHQPLGFAPKDKALPPEQEEIFEAVLKAKSWNPKGAVVACLCGHMHVDRLEFVHGIPCLCINSASYFWGGGMQPYRDPLFAFIEFDPAGELRVSGRKSEFVRSPSVEALGRSASISDHEFRLSRLGGWG